MQKLYSSFPNGRFGIGLLTLRIAAAVATFFYGANLFSNLEIVTNNHFLYISQLILSLLLITGSILFLLGLMIPFVSIVMAVCDLVAVYISLIPEYSVKDAKFGTIALLLLASIAIALFFLGPGAISIDARRYGRERIFIPRREK